MNQINLQESTFKDLGPIDPNRPHIHDFVYIPNNYPGAIAINATIKNDEKVISK